MVSPRTRQPPRSSGGSSRASQHRAATRSSSRTGAGIVHRPGRFVSDAGHLMPGPPRPQPGHGHLRLGERAGLVGADHRRRAERLHRQQLLDQRVPPGHPPHTDRQRHRQRRRESLGNQGDHHPEREDERRHHRLPRRASGPRTAARRSPGRPQRPGGPSPRPARCSGVRCRGARAASLKIRPNSVAVPVAKTTALPAPATTSVPMNRQLRAWSSGPGGTVSAVRRAGSLSPVSAALFSATARGLDQPAVGRHRVTGLEDHDVTGDQFPYRQLRPAPRRAARGRCAAPSPARDSAVRSAEYSWANPITALSSTTRGDREGELQRAPRPGAPAARRPGT